MKKRMRSCPNFGHSMDGDDGKTTDCSPESREWRICDGRLRRAHDVATTALRLSVAADYCAGFAREREVLVVRRAHYESRPTAS